MSNQAVADRTLEHEAVIDAPVAEVWTAWTTSEGFSSWAVAKAEIDLRIGGDMRTSYNAQSNLIDDATIVNRILSYEPQRMLSIKNVQAPAAFKNPKMFQDTWTVVYLNPLGPDRTSVRIIGMGYGEGAEWDDLYSKFKAGNQWTLDKLREKFAKAKSAGDETGSGGGGGGGGGAKVMELLRTMAGGEWIHDGTKPDGSVFRVRNIFELGPGGHSLAAKGWLGDADGMFEHGNTQIWCDPPAFKQTSAADFEVRFQNVNEDGALARGGIRLVGEREMEWDWNATARDGQLQRYRVRMILEDADHYRFVLSHLGEGAAGAIEPKKLVDLQYTRVKQAPAAFLKIKSAH